MLPADDRSREMTVARPDADPALPHLAVVGDVYTVLVSGKQSGGRYALIDMYVPPGGGPPPHRHDFEEMFHVLEGTVEVMVYAAIAGVYQLNVSDVQGTARGGNRPSSIQPF